MTQTDTDLALAEISAQWQSLIQPSRPDGMWVARHLPMARVTDRITTDVDGAWFFDGSTFHSRLPSDCVRFIAVQSGGFWYSGMGPAPSSVFHAGRHDIGLAYFAEDLGTSQIYIETIFGGLQAAGILYNRTPTGLEAESTLWLS